MTDSLPALAARVEAHADVLRARAARLVTAAGTVPWQSPAAARFRQEVDELARHMLAVAGRVDCAAAAVRRHARTTGAISHAAGSLFEWLETR